MSCLEQTQIGFWNNGRKTDMCGLRDEYDTNYSRFVGVSYAAYPTAACGVFAGARHPSLLTGFDSLCVQRNELDYTEGEARTKS